MSEWVDIPLPGEYGKEHPVSSSYVSEAALVNLMLKRNPPGARTNFHVSSIPVMENNLTTPGSTGVIRGICIKIAEDAGSGNDKMFAIRGADAYRAANLVSWTTLTGTMAGSGMCRMVDAGTHIVATDTVTGNARTIDDS